MTLNDTILMSGFISLLYISTSSNDRFDKFNNLYSNKRA